MTNVSLTTSGFGRVVPATINVVSSPTKSASITDNPRLRNSRYPKTISITFNVDHRLPGVISQIRTLTMDWVDQQELYNRAKRVHDDKEMKRIEERMERWFEKVKKCREKDFPSLIEILYACGPLNRMIDITIKEQNRYSYFISEKDLIDLAVDAHEWNHYGFSAYHNPIGEDEINIRSFMNKDHRVEDYKTFKENFNQENHYYISVRTLDFPELEDLFNITTHQDGVEIPRETIAEDLTKKLRQYGLELNHHPSWRGAFIHKEFFARRDAELDLKPPTYVDSEIKISFDMIKDGLIRGLSIVGDFLEIAPECSPQLIHRTMLKDCNLVIPYTSIFKDQEVRYIPNYIHQAYNVYVKTSISKLQMILSWDQLTTFIQNRETQKDFVLHGQMNLDDRERSFTQIISTNHIGSIVINDLNDFYKSDRAIKNAETIRPLFMKQGFIPIHW